MVLFIENLLYWDSLMMGTLTYCMDSSANNMGEILLIKGIVLVTKETVQLMAWIMAWIALFVKRGHFC